MKPNSRRFVALSGRVLRATLLGLALITIFLAGTLYYQYEKTVVCQQADAWLAAVTDTKATAIANWLHERRGDAEEIFESELLVSQLAQALTTSAADNSALTNWLNNLQRIYGYERITLFDAQGAARLSAPGGGNNNLVADAEVRAALSSRQIILADLHREADGEVRLALLMPVRAERASDRPASGVLALVIDPDRDLYPLVQSWPTHLASAEVLLVRREGNDLLYLNELRYRAHSTLNYRVPLTQTNMPAARLMLGDTNMLTGVDYRGVRVRASGRQIAGSPWGLVAKVDAAELLAPLRREAWYIAGLSGLLLTLVAGAMLLMSRQQRLNTFRRQLELEWQHQESQHQVRALFDNSLDGVLITSPDGQIHAANPAACRLLQLSEAEIFRRGRAGIVDANDARLAPLLQQRTQTGQAKGEVRFLRGDGTPFEVELSCAIFETKAGLRAGIIFRDLTARRQLEENLRASVRCRTTISACNHELVRAQAEPELLQRICNAIIQHGGYRMVWVGFAQADETKTIRIGASAGHEAGYLAAANITWSADDERGRGPSGIAFRTGEPVVCNDFQADPRTVPWRAEAAQRGFASSISLPLKNAGQIFGVMMIYSQQLNAFTADEIDLLTELADDLAYGIHHLRTRAERMQTEAALRVSEARFRQLFEGHAAVMLVTDPATGNIVDANPAAARFYGWSVAHIKQMQIGEINTLGLDALKLVMAKVKSGEQSRFEFQHRLADGSLRDVELCSNRIEVAGQSLLYTIVHDITSRKQAEAALAEERLRLQTLVQNLPLAVYLKDMQHRKILANPEDVKYIGQASEAAVLGKTDFDFFPPTEAAQTHAEEQQIFATGEPLLNHEEKLTRPDGSFQWLLTSKVPLRNAAGQIIGLVGLGLNITDKKLAEQSLADERRLLRTLVDSLPVSVYLKDTAGRKILANKFNRESIGTEVVGKTDFEMFRPEDAAKFNADDQQVFQTGQPLLNVEESHRRPDGSERWVLTSKVPLLDADGQVTGLVGIGLDITEKKSAELALRRQTEELQARNDELNRFNRLAVGRELKMIELKREVNELCQKLAVPPRHKIVTAADEASAQKDSP